MSGAVLSVKGPKGALSLSIPAELKIDLGKGTLTVAVARPSPDIGSLHGLYRSLVANMVAGVARGYVKELEIQGVGFKASVQGRTMMFSLGFARPVEREIPEGVEVKVSDGVNLVVSGADKQRVGDVAAGIKALFPAEPYKGKGIRFKGEHVRRKVGKTVA